MAARGNTTIATSSSLRPPGLSSGFYFGSSSEQRDYERYLLSQFTVWQKERRRCFYLARRSLKKKTHSTFSTCVFSSSSVSSSITCLFPQVQRFYLCGCFKSPYFEAEEVYHFMYFYSDMGFRSFKTDALGRVHKTEASFKTSIFSTSPSTAFISRFKTFNSTYF